MRRIGTLLAVLMLAAAGCRGGGTFSREGGKASRRGNERAVRRMVCLFDQHPWLNMDAAGDRDPEGVRFRVFLDVDDARGVLREGTFHVEMYLIKRNGSGDAERELVSDWHYPAGQFNTVSAKILGKGYHVQLRWARKDLPGHEVEIIARFEDAQGRVTRAGTKRLRIPKYTS